MKNWQLIPKKSDDIVEQLLINRQIEKKDWTSFLNPKYNELYDPMLLLNMKKAVDRFQKACKQKETIGIFGDYDADGIPGTALMYEYIKKIGLKSYVYIPTREQGYGLNKEGIDYFLENGVNLLLTIDLGVRNSKEIEYAKSSGIDVIILDHHEMAKMVPKCIIINPKQKGDKYPFKELAAAGVVFKFIQGVNSRLKLATDNYLKWALDLVAIATICDCVPLIKENRIFAKFGMIVLKKTKRVGLKALYNAAEIAMENISPYTVGYQIGPRINAPGRMKNANPSFYLLISKDENKAFELASFLNTVNFERQKELKRVLEETKKKIIKDKLDKKKVILVYKENWPQGLVGLVAGKLMEEYSRPVIIFEKHGNILRGSARSIDAYDIISALDSAKDYLLKYGGHKKAAGLSLELENFDNLYAQLLKVAEIQIKDEDLLPKVTIDKIISIKDINLALFDKISQLEPFGLGNPRPVFLIEKVRLANIKLVGKSNEHLKFTINGIKAIGFGLGNVAQKILKTENALSDIVFTIDEDNWRERQVQLKILDLKLIEQNII